MLKALLQVLISKVGVVDTATTSLISGEAVVPAGVSAKENRVSGTAPFSGYAVATVKCSASVVNLIVNSKTFEQVISNSSKEVLFQSVHAPCAKGDTVEVAVLAQSNGALELRFFPINNGK
ncbi:hypothetical protein [Parasutterella excrementihominis]|uniref:hypothetical protein n=1 Tax=Parasutterella excrementihominis TaxID=487175 RepID=UPI0024B6A66D|nr:hypothetical protein [Parasutterella excrementihominis]